MSNLARRGPQQVWNGYKTMRVPEEIFNDVKKFMERRKQEYLAEREGIELSEDQLPHSQEYSLPKTSKEDIQELVREAVRQELTLLKGGLISGDLTDIPPAKITTSERVLQLLKKYPEKELTTKQIEKILDLPGSTARQVTRELAEEDPRIEKREGRPNKFIFHES